MGHSVSAERDRAASSEMVRCAEEEFRLARESMRRAVLLGVVSTVVVPLFGGGGNSGVLREVSNEFDEFDGFDGFDGFDVFDEADEANEANDSNDNPPCCCRCCCCCRLEGMATGDPTAKLCPGEAPVTANITAPALEVALEAALEGRAILEELLLPAEDVDWTRATSLLVAANAKTSRICV